MSEDFLEHGGSDDRSVIDVVERTLGTTLEDWSRSGYKMTPDLFLELHGKVSGYYRANKIPRKPLDELRPGIFGGYNVGFRYPVGTALETIAAMVVKAKTHELKRLLLYSDRVVVPDPLLMWRPRIPDQGDPGAQHDPPHKLPTDLQRAVASEYELPPSSIMEDMELYWPSAFFFYSQYKNLICRRYVLPVDGGALLDGSLRNAAAAGQIDLEQPLRKIFAEQKVFGVFDEFATYATHALTQVAHKDKFGGMVDPFFVAPEVCDAYALILRHALRAVPGSTRRDHLTNAYLSNDGSIDASKLSEEDVLRMRESEELFQIWRSIVQDVLGTLYRKEPEWELRDRGSDVVRLLKEQKRRWRSDFTRLVGKSSVLEGVFDKTTVSLGIMTGGLASYSGAGIAEILATAGAGGALAPLLSLLFNSLTHLTHGPIRRSLDHHFMALGERGS